MQHIENQENDPRLIEADRAKSRLCLISELLEQSVSGGGGLTFSGSAAEGLASILYDAAERQSAAMLAFISNEPDDNQHDEKTVTARGNDKEILKNKLNGQFDSAEDEEGSEQFPMFKPKHN